MTNFRTFLQETEEKENVKKMISRLPKGHQKLLDGYKFKFTGGNTLPGDDGHIGLIYQDKITVASPWNYGRNFTTLHEIAHLVWEYKMTPKLKKEWGQLVKKYKPELVKKVKEADKSASALDQNDEEIFCMIYANAYAETQVVKYDQPEWIEFIKAHVPE